MIYNTGNGNSIRDAERVIERNNTWEESVKGIE